MAKKKQTIKESFDKIDKSYQNQMKDIDNHFDKQFKNSVLLETDL